VKAKSASEKKPKARRHRVPVPVYDAKLGVWLAGGWPEAFKLLDAEDRAAAMTGHQT